MRNVIRRAGIAACVAFALTALAAWGADDAKDKPAYPLWDGHETVAEYAKRVGLEPTQTLDLGNGVKMEMLLIPAGKMIMGSLKSEHKDDAPEVIISKPFYLGKYVVTQEQYEQIMGVNPSHYVNKTNPVERVSWKNAQDFCMKAGEKLKVEMRLPTDAEWEFACRAGMNKKFLYCETLDELGKTARYVANSGGWGSATHPVGELTPNPWGLYDMLGNAYQWCQDWYEDQPTITGPDPTGPAEGTGRVVRGGSWHSGFDTLQKARAWLIPSTRMSDVTFRVVVTAPKAPAK